MDTFNQFVNAAQQLATISTTAAELVAQKEQHQANLFEAFRSALQAAVGGQPEDWQKVTTQGFAALDDESVKKLLNAKTVAGDKANTLWRADKGFSIKAKHLSAPADALTLVAALRNPFVKDERPKVEKSEWEKMAAAIKAVSNRLEKGTAPASHDMAASLQRWLLHYQALIQADKDIDA